MKACLHISHHRTHVITSCHTIHSIPSHPIILQCVIVPARPVFNLQSSSATHCCCLNCNKSKLIKINYFTEFIKCIKCIVENEKNVDYINKNEEVKCVERNLIMK